MPKILHVKPYVTNVPVNVRISKGYVKNTNHLIVEIYTNAGVVGIGEGTPYAIRGKTHSDIYSAYVLCKKIGRKIVEKRIYEAKEMLPLIQKEFMENLYFDYGPFLALETAVMDAISKIEKVRFAEVLGGFYRNTIPVCGTVFLGSPEVMAKSAAKWISRGVKHLKIKVIGERETDAANLRCIREAIGYEPLIRIDANEAYRTVEKAVSSINSLERYEVAIVEQPIAWNDLDGLRKIRRSVTPKIMIDESLTEPTDIELIYSKEAADIVNFHPSKLGCLSITKNAIEETMRLGLEFMVGSAVMTGIGVAAHLQLSASLRELCYPNEEVGLWEMFGEDIVVNPLNIVNGFIKLPKKYGVGVDVDVDKLGRYEIRLHPLITYIMLSVYRKLSRSIKKINKNHKGIRQSL